MKKLLLNIVLLISLSMFSQKQNPFIIEHCKDKMTEVEYYFCKDRLICSNPQKTKGFVITQNFKMENGVIVNNGFTCKNVNIGNCDENDSLIFLFEDDSKVTLTAWNKFNCEGNAYFDVTDDQLKEFSLKKITTIRFTNGRTFDSYTYTLTTVQKDYLLKAYTDYKVVEIDCSK